MLDFGQIAVIKRLDLVKCVVLWHHQFLNGLDRRMDDDFSRLPLAQHATKPQGIQFTSRGPTVTISSRAEKQFHAQTGCNYELVGCDLQ